MKSQWNWGKGIALFLGLFLLINAVVIFFAFNQKIDLVQKDYYETGLKYQNNIDKQNNSLKLPERLQIKQLANELELALAKDFLPSSVSGSVRFYRPSDNALDFSIPVSLDSTGTQRISLGTVARGYWRVTVDWTYGTTQYQDELKLVL